MTPETVDIITKLLDNSSPRRLEGWCWPDKAFAMCELIEQTKPRVMFESGIFGGRSLIPQALALKDVWSATTRNTAHDQGPGVIFGTDPWTKFDALEGEHAQADADWWAKIDLGYIMRRFLPRLDELQLVDIAVPIRATTHTALKMFAEESIDIGHIDGNHSEVASLRDIADLLPRVKLGGFVWLDDIKWPTNAAAVRTMDALCDTVRDIDGGNLGYCRLYRKVVP